MISWKLCGIEIFSFYSAVTKLTQIVRCFLHPENSSLSRSSFRICDSRPSERNQPMYILPEGLCVVWILTTLQFNQMNSVADPIWLKVSWLSSFPLQQIKLWPTNWLWVTIYWLLLIRFKQSEFAISQQCPVTGNSRNYLSSGEVIYILIETEGRNYMESRCQRRNTLNRQYTTRHH